MKFIFISTACFLIMLLLCVYSASCVIKTVDETAQILEKAIETELAGNDTQTQEIIKEASESWENHQLFFGTVLRHDEIDNVTEEFARLESYATTEDQDDFLSNCKALIARLKHVQEMEKLTLQNIM